MSNMRNFKTLFELNLREYKSESRYPLDIADVMSVYDETVRQLAQSKITR